MISTKNKLKQFLFIAAMTATLIYSMTRIIMTLINNSYYSNLEVTVSLFLLASELLILIHAGGYTRHLLRSTNVKDWALTPTKPLKQPFPTVAILVAARHEPKEVLEDTFRSIINLHYPAKNVYFLDDSSDENYKEEAEAICKKFEINLFRREKRHGAKAGIINDCLHKLKEKYVVIFDADQTPMPSFLTPLIPLLEENTEVAFIQTPQFYHNMNIRTNPVAYGAAYQQAVFYEYICESKGMDQAMFACGTNVVFRKEALLSVNGFDEAYITEDVATSIRLHMAGWKSLYYNHVGTFGMGPEALAEYFKQQARWARGSFGLFRKIIKELFIHPRSLTANQWIEYLLSGSYYFVGPAFLVLMLCPILYIFFDVPSFFIKPEIYITVFIPYFFLSLGVFYMTLRERKYKIGSLFIGQTLASITFPIYIKAAFFGLLGIQGSFGITSKGKQAAMSYLHLWPQLTMLILNLAAFVWGIKRFIREENFAVVANCVWVAYHFIIMSSIFYFNSSHKTKELK